MMLIKQPWVNLFFLTQPCEGVSGSGTLNIIQHEECNHKLYAHMDKQKLFKKW